jgi:nitroreductase
MNHPQNEVVNLLKSHRSIRTYTREDVADDVLEEILASAQAAPSSHNAQAYSILAVRNPGTKEKLAEVCMSQRWVANCPVFLVFCMDYYRLWLASEKHDSRFEIGEVEHILVGAIDAALAGQNAMTAARSFGLGGVFIGGIRENPQRVSEILNLPKLTVPLMGLCLGYPDQEPWLKPRLPRRAVVHYEIYDTDQLLPALEVYEAETEDYYTRRTEGRRTEGWMRYMADYYTTVQIPELRNFILLQGLNFK